MKKSIVLLSFVLGFSAAGMIFKLWNPQPFDLGVFRSNDYELWVQVVPSSPIIMSSYKYEIRYRKICPESGNICSEWEHAASPLLDAPYRFVELKLTDKGDGPLSLQLPESVTVKTADRQNWTVEKGH